MPRYYVTGKIARLDIGAEIDSDNAYMAAIDFKERFNHLLHFGTHQMQVLEVEEVTDDK